MRFGECLFRIGMVIVYIYGAMRQEATRYAFHEEASRLNDTCKGLYWASGVSGSRIPSKLIAARLGKMSYAQHYEAVDKRRDHEFLKGDVGCLY